MQLHMDSKLQLCKAGLLILSVIGSQCRLTAESAQPNASSSNASSSNASNFSDSSTSRHSANSSTGEALLQPLPPAIDATAPKNNIKNNILNGQVTRSDTQKDPQPGGLIIRGPLTITGSMQIKGPVTITGPVTFTGQTPSEAVATDNRAKLSAEEYRKLNYGIIGVVITAHPPNDNDLKITHLYPDCPAVLAGMQEGDVIVQADQHVFQDSDGQTEFWHAVGGKAGTPVDVIVVRKGERLTFHLIRMNIEDFKDENLRRLFETYLSSMGLPQQ
jgi:hypothetical protein